MRRFILALAATAGLATVAQAQTAATPGPAMTPPTATVTTAEVFVIAKPTDVLSTNLSGLKIVDPKNETIGEIKDLVLSDGMLAGYIVSVGGFLGIAEKHVIVSPGAIQIVYSENDKKWSASMNTTKEALKSAPEFRYEGRWAK